MTIEIIKEQIDVFIKTPNAEVMAIKGGWGVGKTFTWNKYLLEAKDEGRIALNKYSYVSLFGLNSLEAFKFSIFESVVDKKLIGKEVNLDTFKENSGSSLLKLTKQGFSVFKGSSLLSGFGSVIESLSFLSLNQVLLCIDDLERSGKELEIKDVLGLVSQLKEQKKCKIVILLNDGEEGLRDYEKYKEKVIDIELQFSPTPEECTEIAFEKNKISTPTLKSCTNALEIRNIRVLKKIERLVELSLPLVEDFEKETKHQIIQTLALLSWSYYCAKSDQKVPPIDFVTNLGYGALGLDDDKEESDEEKSWRSLLENYGYRLTDELDLVLADSVKRGYFIEADLVREATKINNQFIASKSETSFHDAWNAYHDSFENDQEEVISTLYESFKLNTKYITPTNLNGTVTLFKELGRDDLAVEILDIYAKERVSEVEIFNMEENNFFGDIKDQGVIDKFNEIYSKATVAETPTQILERISGKSGWNQKDEIILSETSIEDYYKLFKKQKGKQLSRWVNTCLQFGKYGNATERQQQIAERATGALKMIGSESDINRLRIRKFGIKLDDA